MQEMEIGHAKMIFSHRRDFTIIVQISYYFFNMSRICKKATCMMPVIDSKVGAQALKFRLGFNAGGHFFAASNSSSCY